MSEEQRASYSPLERLVSLTARHLLQPIAADIQYLCEEVDRFAKAMKEELASQALQGRSGWDKTGSMEWTPQVMADRCRRRAEAMDPVSAANYAMFLWHRQELDHREEVIARHREEVAKQIGGVERQHLPEDDPGYGKTR